MSPFKTITRIFAGMSVNAEDRHKAFVAIKALERQYVAGNFPAWSTVKEGEAIDSLDAIFEDKE